MQITSITLHNFKRFRDSEINFKGGITLLVGGNNGGKSTLIHALAVWQFCVNYLSVNRGKSALLSTHHNAGIGLNIDDFTPINIPQLKYLWNNLRPSSGYSLKLRCNWSDGGSAKILEMGLALANEKLFVKTTYTNVLDGDKIPNIIYLPSFAGITDKEVWYYPAQRQKLIGEGLAGRMLRNVINDLYTKSLQNKQQLKEGRARIKKKDLNRFKESDPFEVLNNIIFVIFQCQLFPKKFDQNFSQYIHIELCRGNMKNGRFVAYPGFKKRDIMVEGSGFLQWLSVFAYALKEDVDVLLLDEPDAHLHCNLQLELFNKLQEVTAIQNKQIIIATHSTEIIKNVPVEVIMDVNNVHCKYITNKEGVIRVLSGLGADYCPILEDIVKTQNVLFVENESDALILKSFAKILGRPWPSNLTVWGTATTPEYRKHVYYILKGQINGIKCLSLNDKDSHNYNDIKKDLSIGSFNDTNNEDGTFMLFRMWRRSEIENYLFNKNVLIRMENIGEDTLQSFFSSNGLVLPTPNDFIKSDMISTTKPFFELSGKEYIQDFCKIAHCNKFEIVKEFHAGEVCEDIITLIDSIISMCS